MDVAADEELVRRATAALKADLGVRALGGREKCRGGLRAATGVAERLRAPHQQLAPLVLIGFAEASATSHSAAASSNASASSARRRALDREVAGVRHEPAASRWRTTVSGSFIAIVLASSTAASRS